MPHAEVDNPTPYVFAPAFVTDAEMRPLLVPLAQATVSFGLKDQGALVPEPDPIRLGGEPSGEPAAEGEEVSFRFEPQLAPRKLGTDVIVHGHVYPQAPGATEQVAVVRVGPLATSLHVVGDRHWERPFGVIGPSPPAPIEAIPLTWERAFGGWDRSQPDPSRHRFEPRNPVGRGFRRRDSRFEEGLALPNLEHPRDRLRRWGSAPEPHAFGFVSPGWKPRVELAGTYDERWTRERQPCLPKDFDPRFWSAAPRELTSRAPLRGDEAVQIEGVSRRGGIGFRLPALISPRCRARLARGGDAASEMQLDTIVIDVDRERILLLWRGCIPLRDGPHDVAAIELREATESVARSGQKAA
jgi:hypothetical protein